MAQTTNPHDVLEAFVSKHPTQRDAADALEISQAYINDLLHNRRDFSDAMLRKLGLRRIIVKAAVLLLCLTVTGCSYVACGLSSITAPTDTTLQAKPDIPACVSDMTCWDAQKSTKQWRYR